MTNEELIDWQMCQMCNQRCNCISNKRDRCTPYEEAVELLKKKDQQFIECLEKLQDQRFTEYDKHSDWKAIQEIINEFSKKK